MTEVVSYKLTGYWVHIVKDGLLDVDALPDEEAPYGWVKFTPLSPKVIYAGDPSTAYTVGSVEADIVKGVLTDLQGREGIYLASSIGGVPIQWQAKTHLEFAGHKIPFPTIEFTVESDSQIAELLPATEGEQS